jgi:hypothetical protein
MVADKSNAARSPASAGAPLSRGTRTAHLRYSIAAWPPALAWLFLQTHSPRRASFTPYSSSEHSEGQVGQCRMIATVTTRISLRRCPVRDRRRQC